MKSQGLKVGLIGVGGWGANLARTLAELEALGGVAEIRQDIRAELATLYPGIPIYRDHRALLASGLPAVAIATPAATHYEVGREALMAGKHVFVEKPLALRTAEAEELVALARERGLTLMVGHLLLYQPAIQWIKDFLSSGKLGEVLSLHQERLNLGRVRTVENALWSLGVHDLAVLLYLTGEAPAGIVAEGHVALPKGASQVEDDVYLHLRFPSGVNAHLHVSWLWPEKRRRLTIVGEENMLVYDELAGTVTLHRKGINPDLTSRNEGEEVVFSSHEPPLKLELEHFLECVAVGKRPLSDGESAVEVVRVLEEADKYMHPDKERE